MNYPLKKADSDLQGVLLSLWNNPHSSFYRKKYEEAGLSEDTLSYEKLPFLTKEDIQKVPPDERLFIASSDVTFVAYTSGTTSGKPLVMYGSDIDNYHYEPTLGIPVQRLLITFPPLNKNFGHTFIQQCRQARQKTTPVFADYQNLANSALIARETHADGIYATPTIALLLAEHIQKYYDPHKIKLLVVGGETFTDAGRAHLQTLYPRATIANVYGSAEIGQLFFSPCTTIMENEENFFHLLDDAVADAELVDDELVVTYTKNKAFPLMRYRTGDSFAIVRDACPCGRGPVLRFAGRKDVDKIRINGVEMHASDVEEALRGVSGVTGQRYQLHFYEQTDNGKVKIKIIAEIIPPEKSGDATGDIIRASLQHALCERWRLTPTATLRDAITKGLFTEPEVRFVDSFSVPSAKARPFVNHIS